MLTCLLYNLVDIRLNKNIQGIAGDDITNV